MKCRTALIYSLTLHIALALSLITWPYNTPAPIENTALHSFLYSAPTTSHQQTPVHSVSKRPLTPTGLSTAPKLAINAATPSIAATTVKTNQDNSDVLLQLLHNAIQAQQHYPDSALAMQREGIVQVAFVLAPDGTITELTLLHSSGSQSLDTAALDAINQATPFHGIAALLHHATRFQLEVGFVLP